MARLTAAARQKLGERRRELKTRDGVEERLVEVKKGEWQLEYWREKEKLEVIPLT
jgi:hypothetical protein